MPEQAAAYQAALETVWAQPWLAGIYWWNWDTSPYQGGANDGNFTPHGKPAEEILRSYYLRDVTSLGTISEPDQTWFADALLDQIQQRAVSYFW